MRIARSEVQEKEVALKSMSLQLTGSKEQGVCLPRKIDPKKCYKEDLVHTVHLIHVSISSLQSCSLHSLFFPVERTCQHSQNGQEGLKWLQLLLLPTLLLFPHLPSFPPVDASISFKSARARSPHRRQNARRSSSLFPRSLASSLAPDYPFLNDLKETRNEM